MSFRQNVIGEAYAQRDLRRGGQEIPADLRRYARFSGAILCVGGALAMGGFMELWTETNNLFVFGILLAAVISVGGLAQLLTGLHLLTRR